MYLYPTILNFLLLFLFQVIIFKFINYKKNWHFVSTIIFTTILTVLYFSLNIKLNYIQMLDYLFFNFIILVNYLIFLTLVFNGSPSIFYLKNKNKKLFLKKEFVKNRINLMKSSKLILRNNKITTKGYLVLRITNFFSALILRDDI